ncbi:hypothetical protein C7974DRAFT_40277 [Boeremia exigua]|uniref:uncharacterized protein n=1 Tax=Boeremia exigua TaxID=749465 RepID=UPI001E8D8E71|nr:uncharacterized protein C7974DRAFT_40277 [Boeremia exigua]KAH6618995.1 hypothetical protein C7974DRAFT_40277 [Boeremia exigua]
MQLVHSLIARLLPRSPAQPSPALHCTTSPPQAIALPFPNCKCQTLQHCTPPIPARAHLRTCVRRGQEMRTLSQKKGPFDALIALLPT